MWWIALLLPGAVPVIERAAEAIAPESWISGDDYPRIALQTELEGTVEIRYVVGADGSVRSCTVAGSSGSAVLDATSCALVELRGRYRPASDRSGKPIEQTLHRRIKWVLPRDEAGSAGIAGGPMPSLRPFSLVMEFDVDGEGVVRDCRTTWASGLPGDPSEFCRNAGAQRIQLEGGTGAKSERRKLVYRTSMTVEEIDAAPSRPVEKKPRRSRGFREPAP